MMMFYKHFYMSFGSMASRRCRASIPNYNYAECFSTASLGEDASRTRLIGFNSIISSKG